MNYKILINKDAGTVRSIGKDNLKAQIEEIGFASEDICIESFEKLEGRIKDSAPDQPFLIGGGDGTVRSMAEIFFDKQRPFGILPLGTMNLLARDMHLPLDLKDALKAYKNGSKQCDIDTAFVNDVLFLCSACLGAIPETSKLREENRNQSLPVLLPQLTFRMLAEMQRMYGERLFVTVDGKEKSLRASAFIISNNLYDKQQEGGMGSFHRANLRGGVLGLYTAFTKGLLDRLRLLFRLRSGAWQHDPSIREWAGQNITIKTGKPDALLSVDGETLTLSTPLEFVIKPKSLKLIVPKMETDQNE